MNDLQNNKELVAAGHEFARLMSSDTAIIEIAKMVTRLAERLDCTTAALRAMQSERDQLAADCVAIKAMNDCLSEELRGYESDGAFDGPKMHLLWWKTETPATDRFIAEQQSIGIQKAADSGLFSNWVNQSLISFAITVRDGDDYAAQLRNEVKV